MDAVQLTQDNIAEGMLYPLFRCIDDQYKVRYALNIWEQFEGAIRSAAYTGSLKTFLSNFSKRMPIYLQGQYIENITFALESGEDDKILTWLRDETAYMTLLVRLMNQKRREYNEAEKDEKENVRKKRETILGVSPSLFNETE
jgi:hypothetical protein